MAFFRLVVPAECTVEVHSGVQSVTLIGTDGEVELLIELKVPVKPVVPAEYWQYSAGTEIEPPPCPRPAILDPEDECPF
jgi:hypothetical protein